MDDPSDKTINTTTENKQDDIVEETSQIQPQLADNLEEEEEEEEPTNSKTPTTTPPSSVEVSKNDDQVDNESETTATTNPKSQESESKEHQDNDEEIKDERENEDSGGGGGETGDGDTGDDVGETGDDGCGDTGEDSTKIHDEGTNSSKTSEKQQQIDDEESQQPPEDIDDVDEEASQDTGEKLGGDDDGNEVGDEEVQHQEEQQHDDQDTGDKNDNIEESQDENIENKNDYDTTSQEVIDTTSQEVTDKTTTTSEKDTNITGDNFAETGFEEVDSNVTLNKSNAADDFDALCDDRTQYITDKNKERPTSALAGDDDDNKDKNESAIQSPMDVDEEDDAGTTKNKNIDNLEDVSLSKASEIDDVEMRSVERDDDHNDGRDNDNVTDNDGKDSEERETVSAGCDDHSDNIEKDTEEHMDDIDDGGNMAQSDTGLDVVDTDLVADEQTEKEKEVEDNVEAEEPGESADICLIPDNDEELTGAEKEQAILARQNAEKEDAEKAQVEKEKKIDENQSTPAEDPTTEDPEVIDLDPANKGTEEEPQKIIITAIVHCDETCHKCGLQKSCEFRFKDMETGKYVYLCETQCIEALTEGQKEKYFIRRKKYMVEDIIGEVTGTCILCKELKICKYSFKQDDDILYICNDDCFNLLTAEEPDKLRLKRNSIRVKDLTSSMQPEPEQKIVARTAQEAELAKLDRENSFMRRCVACSITLNFNTENLQWQTLDFCNQLCLGKYQNQIGEKCRTCSGNVSHQSLGKYCVRFGFQICQFCCAGCLDKYKKSLKNCSYCQKDIANGNEGFLAPVGDNETFKDFCSQICMRSYDILLNPKRKHKTDQCSVCNNKKIIRVEIQLDNREHNFCSNPCFSAFKFVNNIVPDQCQMCSKYFERKALESYTIYNDKGGPQVFCGQICMNMFITQKRKIVFCQWCKVKKYNFDMIEKHTTNNDIVTMCSLNCLVLFGVSLNAISKQKMKCDNCLMEKTPQYHLTMSDSSIRNFCTYQCVMQFQSQFSRAPLTLDGEKDAAGTSNYGNDTGIPFPTGLPKRVKPNQSVVKTVQVPLMNTQPTQVQQTTIPVIANITSLAGEVRRTGRRNRKKTHYEDDFSTPSPPPPPPPLTQLRQAPGRVYTTQIMQPTVALQKLKTVPKRSTGTMTVDSGPKTTFVTVPPLPPKMANKNTLCKPLTQTKGVTCKPLSFNTGCQTDEDMSAKILIPIPVPIYIPQPLHMYSMPFPVPVPFPLPIPIPIFIPTTRNSSNGIMKEIKKIQDKMPADPFEAELLMMAEMVAGDKKVEESDSEDEDDIVQDVSYTNNDVVIADANHSYGEDVLQMALKMATEYDEPAVDLESAMTASTITQPPPGSQLETEDDDTPLIYHQMQLHDTPRPGRGRKRMAANVATPGRNNRMQTTPNKRQRRNDVSVIHQPDPVMSIAPSPTPPSQIITTEKPDANMCLKYTFGVNAWKQWVMTKNADLEKSSIRRKPFKSELLQMTADELNYSLCLFVKEVRKPNGTEYAPDTIYYLVLGIQQYLYENGRIDNIFTDPYYERFTDCLDEVAKKFSILYNDSQYIVTRVEEEHLWECKQLGAHSPHVLLSTLMFFNTKHFNLTTVEEHMQLSFSHIMKHWKRNAQGAKAPGSRNVLLRFYPPQAGGDSRKKKVYEQQENEANPLRCPVRLYEFYLSKCPESVKTRNDVFYLQPERSCVPDSPVWYSTQALSQENLQKMLHRVKMVKEINVALLTI